MAVKTWFITGTSRGFGREWAIAALDRGDKVAATARDVSSLDDLVERYGDAILPIALDVTDRDADFAAVAQAHDHFGRLDIVVNNAGYGHFGMIEEVTEAEARAQIETNLFGALWVTQAALPFMREQGSGHILQVSSIGGISRVPERRHLPRVEVGAGGVQPGAGPGGRRLRHQGHADRAGRLRHRLGRRRRPSTRRRCRPTRSCTRPQPRGAAARVSTPGDPAASAAAVLKIVDAEEPPLRVFFGAAPLAIATKDYESRLKTWNDWQPVSLLAQGGA